MPRKNVGVASYDSRPDARERSFYPGGFVHEQPFASATSKCLRVYIVIPMLTAFNLDEDTAGKTGKPFSRALDPPLPDADLLRPGIARNPNTPILNLDIGRSERPAERELPIRAQGIHEIAFLTFDRNLFPFTTGSGNQGKGRHDSDGEKERDVVERTQLSERCLCSPYESLPLHSLACKIPLNEARRQACCPRRVSDSIFV